jgi:Ca2+-binding EF-hand superfamily protein
LPKAKDSVKRITFIGGPKTMSTSTAYFSRGEVIQHDPTTKSIEHISKYTPVGSDIPHPELIVLKKVFTKMCYFADKAPLYQQIEYLRETLSKSGPERQIEDYSSKPSFGNKDEIHRTFDHECEVARLNRQVEKFQKELEKIEHKPYQRINLEDTTAIFKTFKKKVTRQDVEDMMWEVDEKLDQVIDYDEFLMMYYRNRNYDTGLEAANFFLLVQFLMFDSDENCKVSRDEAMNIILPRLGPEKMQVLIDKLFARSDGKIEEHGQKGGEISFSRYWAVVVAEQRKRFDESEVGQKLKEQSNQFGSG